MAAYVEAAQEAQARANNIEARRLLTRALELLGTTPEGEVRDLTELTMRLLRAMSIASVLGFPHPDALEDFQAADDLCHRHGDRPELMPAAIGVWSYFATRGEHGTSRVAIERLAALVDLPQGSWFAPEVKACLGFEELFAGELAKARRVLEEAWEGFARRPPEAMVSDLWALPQDPISVTACALACVTALEGRMAESEQWRARAAERAEAVGFPRGPFSLAFLHLFMAWVRMVFGDPAGAYHHGRQTIEAGERHGFDYFVVLGRPFVLIREPGVPSSAEMLDHIDPEITATGQGAFRAAYVGNVARAHALLGDPARALERVEDALLLMQKSEEWVHQPDLLRLRAELTAAVDPARTEDVVADLRAAVDVGLAQDSLVLALLAANDLARLPDGVRPAGWRGVLERVVDLLPGDPGCPGIAEARALLDG
jgi:hypothetical protein